MPKKKQKPATAADAPAAGAAAPEPGTDPNDTPEEAALRAKILQSIIDAKNLFDPDGEGVRSHSSVPADPFPARPSSF